MDKTTRALSYLIAAQIQAITLIIAAWLGGDWLNQHYPRGFNWYVVTFTVGMLAVVQSFYVIVRQALRSDKDSSKKKYE